MADSKRSTIDNGSSAKDDILDNESSNTSNVNLRKRHKDILDDTSNAAHTSNLALDSITTPRRNQKPMDSKKVKTADGPTKASFVSRLVVISFQLVIVIFLIYLISPVVFRYSPAIQRSLLFMNFINLPLFLNLSTPEVIGLRCTRTLRLQNDAITYGAWHILPESSIKSKCFTTEHNRTTTLDAGAFDDNSPIVLYLHGNGGSRGGNHRNQLYRRLAYEYNYHVITFDYRGYADSTNLQPSAGGLTDDAAFMYKWLLSQDNVEPKRIIVWGHSLGTAIATRMVSSLPDSVKPKKLILEAPFDTIANAIANHPFSTPFRALPFFEFFFVEPMQNSEALNFDSVRSIVEIKTIPILIIHAQDDVIIPYELGKNLYKLAAEKLGENHISFISVDGTLGLGHKHICKNDASMQTVRKFIES